MAANQSQPEAFTDDMSVSAPPMGFRVIIREFLRDKVALGSLFIILTIILVSLIWTIRLDTNQVMRVNILYRFADPVDFEWGLIADAWNGEVTYLLGADEGGRDVFTQLFLASMNTILIGVAVTTIISFIGISLGVIGGYYAGMVDNIIMRFTDFIMILPNIMIIIVFLVVVPQQNLISFILVMSIFAWTGFCRIIRSRALSEGRLDYISASKTMGTPSWKIIILEMLPNLGSLIMVQLTLNYASSIGLETGLAFLGFGLPDQTPSLGTLISAATSPDVLENRPWVWLPASTIILVLMLCINYVGQALKRSSDAKQRLG